MTISPFSSSPAARQGTPPSLSARVNGVATGAGAAASSSHTSPTIHGSG